MIRSLAAAFGAALLALAPLSAADAQSYPPRPALGVPKPFRVPASEIYTLPNGMQVTLIPYGLAPKVTASLRVYAGNLDEGAQTWLPDLTGEMMKEGAAGRSAEALANAAASMGGGLNLDVTQHETVLSLNVLSEHGADAVRLLRDVARRPDFPATEFDRVRQNLLRNLAVARAQPQPIADWAFARAYWGETHPYGRIFPTEAQLRAYTLDDVRRFHAQNFGARRARLYVAGQFDASAIKAAIAQAYSDWAPGPERLRLPAQVRGGPRVILVDRRGAPQSTVRIGFPAPAAGAPQDIGYRVTNALLGGSFTSRITRNIRETRGYTYSPFSAISQTPGAAVWRFNADVTTDVTGAALSEVFKEIKGLQTTPPPEPEATGIRTWLAGTFILQNASAGGLISSLATRDFHGLPADWLDQYVPQVMAVRSADLQSLAREQLPLDKMLLVVVGDLSKVTPQLRALPELRGATFETVTPS